MISLIFGYISWTANVAYIGAYPTICDIEIRSWGMADNYSLPKQGYIKINDVIIRNMDDIPNIGAHVAKLNLNKKTCSAGDFTRYDNHHYESDTIAYKNYLDTLNPFAILISGSADEPNDHMVSVGTATSLINIGVNGSPWEYRGSLSYVAFPFEPNFAKYVYKGRNQGHSIMHCSLVLTRFLLYKQNEKPTLSSPIATVVTSSVLECGYLCYNNVDCLWIGIEKMFTKTLSCNLFGEFLSTESFSELSGFNVWRAAPYVHSFSVQ